MNQHCYLMAIRQLFAALFAVSISPATHAAVNDILPADYFPPEKNSIALYAYDRDYSGPYSRGNQTLEGRIDSQVLALRAVWATEWHGYRIAPVVVLPAARSRAASPLDRVVGGHAGGGGDARVGLTAWPLADKEKARYLGLTAMAIMPSGDYDYKQILNIGENRWRYVLSGGFQQEVARDLLLELSPEVAWYGDNDDYRNGRRLEQATTYALTGYLRYRLTPAWHVFLGGQQNRGGNTHVNRINQHNPPDNDKVMLGAMWVGNAGQQLLLRVGRDTRIENGFKLDNELLLRFSQSY